MSLEDIGFFMTIGMMVIVIVLFFVLFYMKKPKKDKQLEIIDAYIDSVAKCNGLKMPDESLTIDRKKIFKKITKKLMKDVQEVEKIISHTKYKNFDFSFYANFQGHRIYGKKSKWEGAYNYTGWYLSPEATIDFVKQWPEAKLGLLRLYRESKQWGISEYNKSVDELVTLV